MNALLTIATNTLREAARKKVLLAAVLFGVAFLVLFGIGIAGVDRDLAKHGPLSLAQRRLVLNFIVMAGLYAVNFLTVMTAAFMRAGRVAHRCSWVRRLYCAGSSTHPGQWVSFCAISGILAADCLRADLA